MKLIGGLLIIGGIIFALWLGFWVFAVGGIVQVVDACKATPVESLGIAVGVVRALLSILVFKLSLVFPITIGIAMLNN